MKLCKVFSTSNPQNFLSPRGSFFVLQIHQVSSRQGGIFCTSNPPSFFSPGGKIYCTSNPFRFLSSREDFSQLIDTSCDFKNVCQGHIITSHNSSSLRWNLLFPWEESILPTGGAGLLFFPWAESVFLLAELHSHWSMLEQSLWQTFCHSFASEQSTDMVCFLSKCTHVTSFSENVLNL